VSHDEQNGVIVLGETEVYAAPWGLLPGGVTGILEPDTKVTVLCQAAAAPTDQWRNFDGSYVLPPPFLKISYDGGSGYVQPYAVKTNTSDGTHVGPDMSRVKAC
jgi:hypothetical protein